MKLFGFTFCRNEEKMIPYVMPYIERMGYDKFVVYDNESTDNTVAELKKYPFIEVRNWHTEKFSEDEIINIWFEFYQEFYQYAINNNETVWLTRTDFDEVLFFDGIGCCSGKGCLGGEYLGKYNIFDGKMVELICDENTIKTERMAHTWKGIRGKYWHIYGNKPTVFKINDFPYMECVWGNHEMGLQTQDDIPLKHMQETGYVYGFHLKWIDRELLKERTRENASRGAILAQQMIDNIDRYYEESLLPLSFPLQDYFLIEGSKCINVAGAHK